MARSASNTPCPYSAITLVAREQGLAGWERRLLVPFPPSLVHCWFVSTSRTVDNPADLDQAEDNPIMQLHFERYERFERVAE